MVLEFEYQVARVYFVYANHKNCAMSASADECTFMYGQ